MSTKKDVSMLDKVAKLMALASDPGATEAEAATALASARRLMLKHNISEASLASKKSQDGKAGQKDSVRPEGSPRFQPWEINLAVLVAEYFSSRVTFRVNQTRITFYGFDSDGEIAEYAFGQMLRKIWDLALRNLRVHQEKMRAKGYSDMRKLPPGQTLKEVRQSYITGVILGLARKLEDEKKKDTVEETAIVLSRVDRVSAYIDDVIKPGKGKSLDLPNVSNYNAFYQGVEDGTKLQITAGIGAEAQGALNG